MRVIAMDRPRYPWHNHLVIRRIPAQASRVLLWVYFLCASILAGNATTETRKAEGEVWWSLKPVVQPALPDGSEPNPIDRFINAELGNRGLKAVGPTDKLSLLRRVHLDLIGIPPSPEEQEEFLADPSADAYERVVDRLLANEQHAVRYARHWLDVLRYADADERMTAAPGIYLWRDWVINALNDDVPYDQFVQIQLTGRRASERTQMSATGYRSRKEPRPGDEFALGFLARGTGENPQDLAISAADTVSTAFMGMTVGCAKCHDHMYDPISQKDYYALGGVFASSGYSEYSLAPQSEVDRYKTQLARVKDQQDAIKEFVEQANMEVTTTLARQTARFLMAFRKVQLANPRPNPANVAEEEKDRKSVV